MYNPSRGGVRGGADQFTWESVKNDKHRENYLGHSLKAPVGRWQKGKDLSWYVKERKDEEEPNKSNKSEFAAIKRAEEEAMLIALGQNVVRKDIQPLTKEEMKEALKRNIGDRDDHNIERIDGVGAKRRALLGGSSSTLSNEGVSFETSRKRTAEDQYEATPSVKRSKSKKKSKKHKHKKKSKLNSEYSDSDESEVTKSHKKSKTKYDKSSKKTKKSKKSEYRHRLNSSDSDSDHHKRSKHKR